MDFFESGRDSGGFEAGIKAAVERILVSPQFLFRIEHDPGTGVVHPISDVELASRLSFFLWSSIPDDRLLQLATEGNLKRSSVLEKEVHQRAARRAVHVYDVRADAGVGAR